MTMQPVAQVDDLERDETPLRRMSLAAEPQPLRRARPPEVPPAETAPEEERA